MTTRRKKLEAMLADDPEDQMLRYMLALELQKEDADERSLELFRGLITDQKPYVPAFLMAGQHLATLGHIGEAREMYSAGIEEAKRQGDEHAAREMSEFRAELPA